MPGPAWFSFYARDYVADTGHLTLAQHGAYILLMAHYYATGKPIPANAEQVQRICRCTTDEDRHAVQHVLDEFFLLDGDHYRHARIESELAKAAQISGLRRAAAKAKVAKADANAGAKADANAGANAEQKHTQSQSQSQSQAALQPHEKARAKRSPVPVEVPHWLPLESWQGFVEMRKATKHPLTARAMGMAVKKLAELRAKGEDVGAVLDQSTFNSWKDLWPLKGGGKNGQRSTSPELTAAQQRNRRIYASVGLAPGADDAGHERAGSTGTITVEGNPRRLQD